MAAMARAAGRNPQLIDVDAEPSPAQSATADS